MERLTCLLDTSILIQCIRAGDKSATALSAQAGREGAAISAITLMELEFGTLTDTHREFRDQIIRDFPVLDFDTSAAMVAGRLFRQLRAVNRQIGVPDLMIAAVAIANDLPLATLNEAHFARVPGLRLLNVG